MKIAAEATKQDRDARTYSADGTPMVGGYKMMKTPTPSIHDGDADGVPLMTWGTVVDTPLHLDKEDRQLKEKARRRKKEATFLVPETPSRDELLWKLDAKNRRERQEKESQSRRSSRKRHRTSTRSHNRTPSTGKASIPRAGRAQRTPTSLLSPAAQQLLRRSVGESRSRKRGFQRGHSMVDSQLRASYSPYSNAQTPLFASSVTPSPLRTGQSGGRKTRKKFQAPKER